MHQSKLVLSLLILFISLSIKAQVSLTGRVLNASTQQPIVSASVFLSSTSVGTSTDDKGSFLISRFPSGRYELVVSCIGYETYVQTLQSNDLPSSLILHLKPQINQLQEVIVETYDKEGWKKYGKFFTDNFIGTSSLANDCKIENSDAIKFRYSEKKKILIAFAHEPLIIKNFSLGYEIKYQLEQFEYNYETGLLMYKGFPLFKEMETEKKSLKDKWTKKRQEAYSGSVMHFMRSLYKNTFWKDGFEVRGVIIEPNLEKQRIKKLFKHAEVNKTDGSVIAENNFSRDSLAYYKKIMAEGDTIITNNKLLKSNTSITFMVDEITIGFQFTNNLSVVYTKKLEPFEYVEQTDKTRILKNISSRILLQSDAVIKVMGNGSYYNPTDLLVQGFWSWSEKLCALLPFDYEQ